MVIVLNNVGIRLICSDIFIILTSVSYPRTNYHEVVHGPTGISSVSHRHSHEGDMNLVSSGGYIYNCRMNRMTFRRIQFVNKIMYVLVYSSYTFQYGAWFVKQNRVEFMNVANAINNMGIGTYICSNVDTTARHLDSLIPSFKLSFLF